MVASLRKFPLSAVAALVIGCLSCASSFAADERALPDDGQLPPPAVRADKGIDLLKRLWEQLLPERRDDRGLQDYRAATVLRSLDPQRYPLVPAADGGVILLDPEGTLPMMVKSYILLKEPGLRVVSGSPDNRKQFYNSLLAAGKFLSVDEEVSLAFGEDPTVVAYVDFKIEKKGKGLHETESVLLNVDEKRGGIPAMLRSLLEERGFRIIDAYPASAVSEQRNQYRLHPVSAVDPLKIVDSLLHVLALPYDIDRRIEFAGHDPDAKQVNRVARYFELNGRRFVVAIFNGDPASYTLLRLLETGGYQVIMLDARDDLRKVAGKLLPRLGISAEYGRHDLLPAPDGRYNVRMSGVMLSDRNGGGSIFLTDKLLDKEIEKLLETAGYHFVKNNEYR